MTPALATQSSRPQTAGNVPSFAQKRAQAWKARLQPQTDLQDAIHAPHLADRDRIMEVLSGSTNQRLTKIASTMAQCVSSVHFYTNPDQGRVREYIHTCKARPCPYCARRRARHVTHQVYDQVKHMAAPRHIVLTVKSRPGPLREQIKQLMQWFSKLRRTAFWRANVNSGIYTIETTINTRTAQWHPHLHMIVDGNYMPVKRLQYLWHEITGGSEIVWIEAAKGKARLVTELCKYVGKPQKLTTWTDDQLTEWVQATIGLRMVQSFGKRRPPPIEDATPDQVKADDETSYSLARVLWLARLDYPAAVKATLIIAQRWPHLGRFIRTRHAGLVEDTPPDMKLLAAWKIIEAGKAPPPDADLHGKTPTELEALLIPLLAQTAYMAIDKEMPWEP